MQKQLEFWSDPEEPLQTPKIWENLNHEQQKKIITALSRLIIKTVYPKSTNITKENNHE